MQIIIGLGNPGEKFEHTPHNAGFMAVDFFAKTHDFPEFELSKKHESLISEKNGVLLAKPQTFMNNSGKAAKKLVGKNKAHAIILHDDIDLPLGKLKIVKERGSAGHKGVESIIKAIGNKGLIRFRIGIQPKKGKPKASESYVVKKFKPEEKQTMEKALKHISEAIDTFAKEGLEKAMQTFN